MCQHSCHSLTILCEVEAICKLRLRNNKFLQCTTSVARHYSAASNCNKHTYADTLVSAKDSKPYLLSNCKPVQEAYHRASHAGLSCLQLHAPAMTLHTRTSTAAHTSGRLALMLACDRCTSFGCFSSASTWPVGPASWARQAVM